MVLLLFSQPPAPIVINRTIDFEGGVDGADATGLGDAWATNGSPTFTYTAAGKIKGSLGGVFTYGVTNAGYITLDVGPASGQLAIRLYMKYDTAPYNSMLTFRSASGPIVTFNTGSSGRFVVADSTGASPWGTSTNPSVADTIYRVELVANLDVAGGDGTIDCSVYVGDDTLSPVYDVHTSAATLGTNPFSIVRLGRTNTTGAAGNLWMDDIALTNQTASRTYVGPSSPLLTTGGDLKVWNGSAFVAKPVKVWNGSSWVAKPAKVWNGSSWVETSY